MTADPFSQSPDTYMRTLQQYRTSFEKDRASLNDLVQTNRRWLDAATKAVITGTTVWRRRLEAMQAKVEAATAGPVGPTIDTVLHELEALSANAEKSLPSDLRDRSAVAIALYQLRGRDMETLIRDLIDLNNEIASSVQRKQ